jgi:N-acetyl-gamma-glutamyl-phosphate reductase
MHQAPALLEAGVKVIDLSADFRLKDSVLWREWYGQPHACPELLGTAIYGLPELHRAAIREARLVANPGCYPSAILLALLPLLKAQVADARHLVADAKSGISGAGRKVNLATQFCESGETFKAYALGGHRHHPEMVQCLEQVAGSQVGLTFVPHLVPMVRGILATVYAPLLRAEVDVQALFAEYYRGEPFVSVLPAGSQPDTRSVRGTNLCRLAVHRPRQGDMAVVVSAIDNLMKGAAGQAVQNMNIMFGFPEEQGMKALPLVP